MIDAIKMQVNGHLVIRDIDDNQILVDQHNDIHLKNFGEALAMAISNFSSGVIEEMHFGNGGSTVNSTGSIDYLGTNVKEDKLTADLHSPMDSPVYKVINDRSSNYPDTNTDKNNIKVFPNNVNPYTDIVITCTLDYGEPAGQSSFDNATNFNGAAFIFDEIALKVVDAVTGKKRMLTHVIFHPVQKSLNRAIEITYTIRITMLE